jgi:hypothetical protein
MDSVTRRHVRNLLARVDCLRRAKANPTPDSFCPCRGTTRDLACRMARRVESTAHRGSEHRRSKRGRGEGSAANRCVLVNTSCTGNAPNESLEKKFADEKADFLIALLAFSGIARAQTWPSTNHADRPLLRRADQRTSSRVSYPNVCGPCQASPSLLKTLAAQEEEASASAAWRVPHQMVKRWQSTACTRPRCSSH